MKKLIWYGALIVFVISNAAIASAEFKRVNIPLDDSPSRGPANAKVVIVEFLDYQ